MIRNSNNDNNGYDTMKGVGLTLHFASMELGSVFFLSVIQGVSFHGRRYD